VNVLADWLGDLPSAEFQRLQAGGAGAPIRWKELRAALRRPLSSQELSGEADQVLERGYLRKLPLNQWERAIADARRLPPVEPAEWVVFVAPPQFNWGLLLPQDDLDDQHVSLFERGDGGRTGQVRFNVATQRRYFSDSEPVQHCDLPDKGRCLAGSCGRCRRRYREIKPAGLICICDCAS
jgi:hypothetical protein